jgi:hypothetical protein
MTTATTTITRVVITAERHIILDPPSLALLTNKFLHFIPLPSGEREREREERKLIRSLLLYVCAVPEMKSDSISLSLSFSRSLFKMAVMLPLSCCLFRE